MFFHHDLAPIGIDIGTTTIKIAVLESHGKQIKLANYGLLESVGHLEHFNNAIQSSSLKPLDSDLVAYLTLLRERLHIPRHARVSAALPAYVAYTTLLELPVSNKQETMESISQKIKSYIPIPITATTLDWIKVGERIYPDKTKKQYILVVSIPNEKIDAYHAIFEQSDLSLGAVEVENVSLARALTGSLDQPTLIIDIGGRFTSFSVAQSGNLQFSGQTDFASGSLTQALATGLNISLKRADMLKQHTHIAAEGGEYELSTIMRPIIDVIINEAGRVKDAFENSYKTKVQNILVTGAGANMPGFSEYLSKKMNTPVQTGDALKNILYPPELEPLITELKNTLAVAIGLALKSFS